MKLLVFAVTGLITSSIYASSDSLLLPQALQRAEQLQLAGHITWQRLMYAEQQSQSQVQYSEYFLAKNGRTNLHAELVVDIHALFEQQEKDQAFRCRFPARSRWLMQQLAITTAQLPKVECPEFQKWMTQIKPHKVTLIYATDFMGNPSSMFGHTLLRLDPKDQKQLNLISYAVNYAATVTGQDNWSYAWKGLTGQYPGEYSLMPYYRKVKEYGDLESRDLWEYELNLSEEETRFLVEHIWEMQQVQFPYYFVSDNCAYRLLGLIDLVRPQLNLQQKFTYAAIPIETIKAIEKSGLVQDIVYRPALETQLLSQAHQHGKKLAKTAHQIAPLDQAAADEILNQYQSIDQAKILEMAYDDLYLQFLSRQIEEKFAQKQLRQLLSQRSQLDISQQRQAPKRPEIEPTQGHAARHFSLMAGEVQGERYIELGHRQAYHDLTDPQGGYRAGTQLLFLNGNLQWRDDHIKLEHLDLLTVNAYNPIQPFKQSVSWGFNLSWRQEAFNKQGNFDTQQQHGVANLNMQLGYSFANADRKHLCYAQSQGFIQASQFLEKGWRIGLGPTVGCMNQWSDHVQSVVQMELPYWQDSHAWQTRLKTTMQYQLNANNVLRLYGEYEYQQSQDWNKWGVGYIRFF